MLLFNYASIIVYYCLIAIQLLYSVLTFTVLSVTFIESLNKRRKNQWMREQMRKQRTISEWESNWESEKKYLNERLRNLRKIFEWEVKEVEKNI
jgi:hypothetical protein